MAAILLLTALTGQVPTADSIREDVSEWKSRFVAIEFIGLELHLDAFPSDDVLRNDWDAFAAEKSGDSIREHVILSDDGRFIRDVSMTDEGINNFHELRGSDGKRRYTAIFRHDKSPADAPEILELHTRVKPPGPNRSPTDITPIKPLFPRGVWFDELFRNHEIRPLKWVEVDGSAALDVEVDDGDFRLTYSLSKEHWPLPVSVRLVHQPSGSWTLWQVLTFQADSESGVQFPKLGKFETRNDTHIAWGINDLKVNATYDRQRFRQPDPVIGTRVWDMDKGGISTFGSSAKVQSGSSSELDTSAVDAYRQEYQRQTAPFGNSWWVLAVILVITAAFGVRRTFF